MSVMPTYEVFLHDVTWMADHPAAQVPRIADTFRMAQHVVTLSVVITGVDHTGVPHCKKEPTYSVGMLYHRQFSSKYSLSKILTIDTPHLARKGEVWSVCYEIKSDLDLCSTLVIALVYIIVCYVKSRYNGMYIWLRYWNDMAWSTVILLTYRYLNKKFWNR